MLRKGRALELTSANVQNSEMEIQFEIGSRFDDGLHLVTFPTVRDNPPIEPLTNEELRSIAYANADGWRCFYPASRGHLTAAEARAVMRAERGMPAETAEEAEAAESLLAAERGWGVTVPQP